MSKESAKILRELRREKNLSQGAVAKALGIDRTTYVKYESGGSISRNLKELADFFGVSVDFLLGRSTPPPVSIQATTGVDEYSATERSHIKKFRFLTPEHKEAINHLLDYFFTLDRQKNDGNVIRKPY